MITSQLNTLRQSSARHWRIGQWQDCKTVILYYSGCAQEAAVKHMMAKLRAAEYLEGSLEGVGFAAESADESMESVIMKSLEEAGSEV